MQKKQMHVFVAIKAERDLAHVFRRRNVFAGKTARQDVLALDPPRRPTECPMGLQSVAYGPHLYPPRRGPKSVADNRIIGPLKEPPDYAQRGLMVRKLHSSDQAVLTIPQAESKGFLCTLHGSLSDRPFKAPVSRQQPRRADRKGATSRLERSRCGGGRIRVRLSRPLSLPG
jgi:hypothetical protein